MTTKLRIEGMSCGHCVAHVKAALESVPGVESASVELDAQQAVIEGTVEPADLIVAVQSEGYSARIAEASAPSSNRAPGPCKDC